MQMNKQYVLELIQKQLKGETSKEEDRYLESYYNLFEHEPDITEDISQHEKDLVKKRMYEVISSNIQEDHDEHRKVRKMNTSVLMKLTAAAAIAAISILAIFYLNTNPAKQEAVATKEVHKKENRLVQLPDGSTVIVSAGSHLTFPGTFSANKREVYLEGEAYFDIVHNAAKPFIVHAGDVETVVLGTAFNVKAFPGEKNITVTVTRGKVKVSDRKKLLGLVIPGEQIIYDKNKEDAIHRTVDPKSTLNWKDQDLLVDNVTVEEAAKLLSDRFDVTLSCTDSTIKNKRFTTVFLKTESLDQILKSICEFNGARYSYNNSGSIVIQRR